MNLKGGKIPRSRTPAGFLEPTTNDIPGTYRPKKRKNFTNYSARRCRPH